MNSEFIQFQNSDLWLYISIGNCKCLCNVKESSEFWNKVFIEEEILYTLSQYQEMWKNRSQLKNWYVGDRHVPEICLSSFSYNWRE